MPNQAAEQEDGPETPQRDVCTGYRRYAPLGRIMPNQAAAQEDGPETSQRDVCTGCCRYAPLERIMPDHESAQEDGRDIVDTPCWGVSPMAWKKRYV